MAQRKIGAVCVLDEEGKLIGVFSERDLLNRVVVPRHDPAVMQLGQVTSPLRAVIRCDETPQQALERMEQIGSRHLPVVDDEKWVGMLSIRDLLRESSQIFEVVDVTGTPWIEIDFPADVERAAREVLPQL